MKKLTILLSLVLLTSIGISQTTLDTAVNFDGKDPYGNTIELFEYLNDGKIVLIDFFNSM